MLGFRLGPFKVTLGGFLQAVGDAVKLSNKHYNILLNISFFFYYVRGLVFISRSIILWSLIHREPSVLSLKIPILIFILILALNSFNSVYSGWRTLRKYTLIGRIRTVAQLISYEASLFLCLITIIFLYLNFNFNRLFFFRLSFCCILIPGCFYCWLPSYLAELNRTPYDFSEGERELVRGFNTEFGSSVFTLIFLSEYIIILFFCSLTSFLFFCRARFIFTLFFVFFTIWVRGVLPRFRFDKFISLAWKFLIPFLTLYLLLLVFFIF